MVTCPNCGLELRDEASVCPKCGTRVKEIVVQDRIETQEELNNIEKENDTVSDAEYSSEYTQTSEQDTYNYAYDNNQTTNSNRVINNDRFYKRTWFIILCLIFFWPLGVFLMWKYSQWNKIVKIIISVICFIALISSI